MKRPGPKAVAALDLLPLTDRKRLAQWHTLQLDLERTQTAVNLWAWLAVSVATKDRAGALLELENALNAMREVTQAINAFREGGEC